MRRLLALLLFVIFLFSATPAALSQPNADVPGEYAQGQALALCDADAVFGAGSDRSARGASSASGSVQILNTWDLSATPGLNHLSIDSSDSERLYVVLFGASMGTGELVSYLKEQNGIFAAEPNYIYRADSISNDPYADVQWGLGGAYGVHPQGLWSSSAPESIVAVIDTGIDYNSPDLQGRIAENLAFDAYPSDGTTPGSDTGTQGHGTHVAGIIAAATNNSMGGAGVMGSSACKIMPVRVFSGGTAFASDIVAGISHVIQKKHAGNPVVAANMSLGSKWFSSEIMRYALSQLTQNDILPVRSAGNDSLYINDNSVYPSIFETPGTVAVAAIDAAGRFDFSYSNYSDTCVQIAAPGTDILSTWFKGKGGYIGSCGSLSFDDFENSGAYTLEYAPYKWSSGIINSDARILSLTPQSTGYASARSLQFSIPPSSAYSDYRIILPNNGGQLQSDQSLGFRVRFSSAQPLPNEYSLAAGIGKEDDKPSSAMQPYALDKWYYFASNGDASGSEFSLWLSLYDLSAPMTVSIDDLGAELSSQTGYNVFEGTSMAAPFFTGAYALLRSVYPQKSMAELRARLIGGSRPDRSLTSRVNAGGSVDIPTAVLEDTSSFAPVIDEISQSGNSVTVKGWFFGDSPNISLGSQSISSYSQSGSVGKCSLVFELPVGVSGIQTLTLSKSNGRSYRMRYDYSPRGNMTVLGALPEPSGKDTIARDIFSYGGRLYYLISTEEGFSVCSYENGAYSSFISKASDNDRASRDDFSTFADGSILYVFDFNHIHRFDMASNTWLEDIPGPYPLDSASGFYTGAVAAYKGRLMLLGGKGGSFDGHIRVYENGTWSSAEIIDGSFSLDSARAIVSGDKLIVFAQNNSGFRKQQAIFIFDGASWIKRECPYSDICSCSYAVLNNEVLCFGDSKAKDGILAYNPVSNTWRRLPYRGSGLAYTARGTVMGNGIYAMTGRQNSDEYILQYALISSGGGSSDPSASDFPAGYSVIKKDDSFVAPPATGDGSCLPMLLISFSLCLGLFADMKRPRRARPMAN